MDILEITTFVLWGIVIGMIIGGILVKTGPPTEDQIITKIKQANVDCQREAYYFQDDHRDFCDKIGVGPYVGPWIRSTNATMGEGN